MVAGAQLTVMGATEVADRLGLAEGFVGLTLVALGTSLPELVTAIAAARKGEDELIVGNLLGSNLFNSLAVGATAGLLGPGTLDDPNLAGLGTVVMLVRGGRRVAVHVHGAQDRAMGSHRPARRVRGRHPAAGLTGPGR